jgi:hypothetical protein
VVLPHQPEVGFVNQSGGLEGMVGPFLRQECPGEAMQFPVKRRHQGVESPFVAALQRGEGDPDFIPFVHAGPCEKFMIPDDPFCSPILRKWTRGYEQTD